MCGVREHGDLDWVAWEVRSRPERGRAYFEVTNQTGRREAFVAFSAAQLDEVIAGLGKARRSLEPAA